MRIRSLIIYHDRERYPFTIQPDRDYLLSSQEGAPLLLPDLDADLQVRLDGETLYYQLADRAGVWQEGHLLAGLTFYWVRFDRRVYDPLLAPQFILGNHPSHQIYLSDTNLQLLFRKEKEGWSCQVLSGNLYHNNRLENEEKFSLRYGAEIAFGNHLFQFFPHEIHVYSDAHIAASFAPLETSRLDLPQDFPDWHRSPRLIYRPEQEKIQIQAPGAAPTKPQHELLRTLIPPLLMIAMTLVISIFQPRGLYILLTVAMSLSTMIFSVLSFVKNRKKYEEDKEERFTSYRHYLKDKAMQLHELEEKEKKGSLYHYPDLASLDTMAASFSPRIYEKALLHFDFLHYRLGLASLTPYFSLLYNQKEGSGKKDPLEEEVYQLYSRHRKIEGLPLVANLLACPLGYVGPRKLVLEQLQILISQLSFFHSYHDLQIISILPQEEKEAWDWLRWLPHAVLKEVNVRGLVYDQRSRDQVLNSLYQILKQREAQRKSRELAEGQAFRPHYLVLITDESLILDHVIMEYFSENPSHLGCSLIFVQDVLSSLSENVQTVVSIKDKEHGQLLLEEGHLREQNFQLDHFPSRFDKERWARRLASLHHVENLRSSIPDQVGFMELYESEKVEDLKVADRWQGNTPYKTLSVPIGFRGKGDVVSLDLHEKAHGPHGLVAGTTGSGKSELIQTYILSLALNFHPHDVAFLLIDYKGGGMAHLFKDLPHLLGTITNLDGNQSMRALASINAELKRRQRLFAQHEVNHINQYQKKVKLGQASEPLPHLFLISDEFAELKSNQPEFMKELVSTARIGRSLGIHLILATQKPSGVVDEQIWSNSRFKLALKVADRSDSMEMLKTADAADITQVGRAYLQVGNNEVYELFQSAYSGADYRENKTDAGIEDQPLYLINDLGQYQILNPDLSGLSEIDTIKEVASELDAVVAHITKVSQDLNLTPLPRPWLPPLPERINVQELAQPVNTSSDLSFTFGLADLPHEQKQEPVTITLSQEGHVALYGSPGSGKTSFLQTAVMELARHYNPDQLSFYLLDFGTNGLAALAKLPHVADSLRLDQEDKLDKLSRILDKELKRRKALLNQAGVSTLPLYQQLTGEKLSRLVLVLDSFEGMKDAPYEDTLLKILVRISREGLAVGMHLILTAGRQMSLRAALHSNIMVQMSLPQNDYSDVTAAVGSTPMARQMETIKGRLLMKREEVQVVQVALANGGRTDSQVMEWIRDEVESLKTAWNGTLPSAIPMVPEELRPDYFYQVPSVQAALKAGQIPLGLDLETVEAVSWDGGDNLLYLTDKEEQMAGFLDVVAKSKEKKFLLVSSRSQLPNQESIEGVQGQESLAHYIRALELRIQERTKEARRSHDATILLYNWPELLEDLDNDSMERLAYILQKGRQVGYPVIILTSLEVNRKLDPVSKVIKQTRLVLMAHRLNDQVMVQVTNKTLREGPLLEQEHYVIQDRIARKVKVLIR